MYFRVRRKNDYFVVDLMSCTGSIVSEGTQRYESRQKIEELIWQSFPKALISMT